jgi:hypothetical protein
MEFLMEIMEAREQLEGTPSVEVIDANRAENEKRLDDVCGALVSAFASEDLGEARKLTAQLQYLNRVQDEIKEKEPVV